MPGRARIRARLLVAGVCAIVAGAAATTGGAETPTATQRTQALRAANASLATRARSISLELYSLESKLERTQASLASLRAQQARVALARASVQMQLVAARQNLRASQRQLALRVHVLYEQEAVDPVAVVLGAQSLDEALTTIDDLNRTAVQDKEVAAQSSRAATSLTSLSKTLARQDARLGALAGAAAQTVNELLGSRASKQQFLAQLAAQHRLNDAQIAVFELHAHEQASLNSALAASAAIAPSGVATSDPVPQSGIRTLTVSSTGYSLPGSTASGVPVGWGVVAVDPTVIPLGTRLTIPGYGAGVAADTGSAVRGATIDLWFPTLAQAQAWGRRIVTITLH